MTTPYYPGGGFEEEAGSYNPRFHFQTAVNAGFHTGKGDEQSRTLYVGNLDQTVTEEFLVALFGQVGSVTKTKIIFDGHNDPYAFVEFGDHQQASSALQVMNKRLLLNREMKVNWATEPGQQQAKVDTSKHFHVFVGDLSPQVDNQALKEAFAPFGDISDAKVIRDATTQKSKGYGFVSYPKREEAERAIEQMNGQWLGSRTIRTNWATRKPQEGQPMNQGRSQELSYDDVYNQTTPDNTSVYVGNVAQGITEEDVRESFGTFGRIEEIRIFKAQGYAFVRYDNKESAAKAIVEMSGAELGGQNVRCSWGKSDFQKSSGPQQGGPGGNPYQNYGNGAYGAYGQGQGGAGANGPYNPAAAQQQYWQYYQQYYNNPQYQQQWAQYYQQQQQQQQQGGRAGGHH